MQFILIFLNLFVAKVQALKDLWIVGERGLKDLFPTLQSIRDKATHEKKLPPYICEYFNVFCYYPATEADPVGGIINALIEILNKCEHLPKYLVVFPDKSLVATCKIFNENSDVMYTKIINCIQRNMSRLFAARKEDLMSKKPGAVAESPTHIIWMKMLDRPVG